MFKCKKHIFLGSILKVEGLPNLKLEMSDATAERTATACVAEEPMVEYRQDVICENRFFGWSTATGLKNLDQCSGNLTAGFFAWVNTLQPGVQWVLRPIAACLPRHRWQDAGMNYNGPLCIFPGWPVKLRF